MAYDPAHLQPGDILLMVGRPNLSLGGWLDASIEWATDSPFDHAAIVGDGEIIEALWAVTASPPDKYAENGWAFSVPTVTEEQKQAAIRWAVSHIGHRYGVAELLDDAGRDILHLPLWPQASPRAKARYTCSGLVAAAYASARVPLTWAPWPSPQDLACSPVLVGPRPWNPAA